MGAYPPSIGATRSLLTGTGTTKFKDYMSCHVMVAKAKGLDRLKCSEVARRGLEDLKAVSRLLGDGPFLFGQPEARVVIQ